jgi:hypothetical protein
MKLQTLMCLVVVVFVATACMPPSPPGPAGEDCDRAYAHLGSVGCEPPKPATGTWIEVCRNARRNGLMPLGCINRAATFAAADACGVSCSPK